METLLKCSAQHRIDGMQTEIARRCLAWLILTALVGVALVSCAPLDDQSSLVPAESAMPSAAEEAVEDMKDVFESNTKKLEDYEEEIVVEELVADLNDMELEDVQDSTIRIVVSLRDRIDTLRGER